MSSSARALSSHSPIQLMSLSPDQGMSKVVVTLAFSEWLIESSLVTTRDAGDWGGENGMDEGRIKRIYSLWMRGERETRCWLLDVE